MNRLANFENDLRTLIPVAIGLARSEDRRDDELANHIVALVMKLALTSLLPRSRPVLRREGIGNGMRQVQEAAPEARWDGSDDHQSDEPT